MNVANVDRRLDKLQRRAQRLAKGTSKMSVKMLRITLKKIEWLKAARGEPSM